MDVPLGCIGDFSTEYYHEVDPSNPNHLIQKTRSTDANNNQSVDVGEGTSWTGGINLLGNGFVEEFSNLVAEGYVPLGSSVLLNWDLGEGSSLEQYQATVLIGTDDSYTQFYGVTYSSPGPKKVVLTATLTHPEAPGQSLTNTVTCSFSVGGVSVNNPDSTGDQLRGLDSSQTMPPAPSVDLSTEGGGLVPACPSTGCGWNELVHLLDNILQFAVVMALPQLWRRFLRGQGFSIFLPEETPGKLLRLRTFLLMLW